jgi:UDP-N-acetylmuramoylalanine--D-glutamate ligase
MHIPKKIIRQKKYNHTNFLSQSSFAIYGLGLTGKSVLNLFKKKSVNFYAWDDNAKVRSLSKINKKFNEKNFENILDEVDYLVLSPGINIKNCKLKKKIIKNKDKIITDLDIFYMINSKVKSIMITGSNGKSTTCKIIEHVLKKNKIETSLGGNIGKPILDLKFKKNRIMIIEASSFQLYYSRFISPSIAIILNITNDHLDWHKTKFNYVASKFKIFSNQTKKNYAFLRDKKLINFYKKKNFKAKLEKVSTDNYTFFKNKIKNSYINSKVNEENMNFAYHVAKKFKINKNSFVNSINSFKGLEHRYEVFYKYNNLTFINDSKATSFEASKFALMSNKNIYWIVGGLPKKKDKFLLTNIKKNVIKSYIIGKNINFFKKQLKNKIKFTISKTLKGATISVFKDIKKNYKTKPSTVLLSPASASYDQFKNFNERGTIFKKLVKKYANK